MRKLPLISRIGVVAMVVAGMASAAQASDDKLNSPAIIGITPLSKLDAIAPKSGGQVSDYDGIRQTDGDVVVSAFTLKTVVGGDKVEVSVPEFRIDQVRWVADPIGCVDNDPKTKCHPTWGIEYSGQVGGDLPVFVELVTGGDYFFDDGIVNLTLNVTVVDDKISSIDGYLQISYSTTTDHPNFRIPIAGKLK